MKINTIEEGKDYKCNIQQKKINYINFFSNLNMLDLQLTAQNKGKLKIFPVCLNTCDRI